MFNWSYNLTSNDPKVWTTVLFTDYLKHKFKEEMSVKTNSVVYDEATTAGLNQKFFVEGKEVTKEVFFQTPEEKRGGYKADQGKPRYDLLPREFLDGTAQILAYGANKYSARNWEQGMNWSRPFGAMMRHLWAWWSPFEPDTDEETGKSHLWHAACCLAFLMAYEQRKVGTDDRGI
jgi:hypothetical protein